MTISAATRKALWGKARNQCAFPSCSQALAEDRPADAGQLVVGEEAHIRSKSPGGPRYDPTYSTELLDEYENLLLLCPTHHSKIDAKNGVDYSVAQLIDMRRRHERAQDVSERLETFVRQYLRNRYEHDDKVLFQQVELNGPSVGAMFVDVPFACQYSSPIADVLEKIARETPADQEMTEDSFGWHVSAAALTLLHPDWRGSAVIVGGPGQGKSTLLQYVCQFHRAKLLGKDTYDANDSTLSRSESVVRIPFRVDLRNYTRWASLRVGGAKAKPANPQRRNDAAKVWPGIAEYLSVDVEAHTDFGRFKVNDFVDLITSRPALVALDGLDEVADPDHRSRASEAIADFRTRFVEEAADLVVLVTTRPGGNPSALTSSGFFPSLVLRRLSQGLRIQYLQNWSAVLKLAKDVAENLQSTFQANQNLPHIRELASTPMQLAILLHLLHRRQLFPQQRTELYKEYLKTFLDREETEKKEPLLAEVREVIEEVHSFLAWHIQCAVERGEGNGSIKTEELRELLRRYLQDKDSALNLADRLFSAFTGRVLCLIERDGAYQFEVQSLREYFTASYIFENAPPRGNGNSRDEVLSAMLERPYWSNVARFFVGMLSKVEVRGLAESLRQVALSVAPHQHRALGAQFLEDRTFEGQADRPFRDMVDLILEGPGVVFAEHGLLANGGAPLSFGERAGRTQAVDHLKGRLQDETGGRRQITASLLRRNVNESDQVENWWWERFAPTDDWLATAADLGALTSVAEDRIDSLVEVLRASRREDEWITNLLLRGGFRGSDDRIIEAVMDELNDGASSAIVTGARQTPVGEVVDLALVCEVTVRAALPPHDGLSRGRARNRQRIQSIRAARAGLQQSPIRAQGTDWASRLAVTAQAWGDGWVLRRAVSALPGDVDLDQVAAQAEQRSQLAATVTREERTRRSNRSDLSWWRDDLGGRTSPSDRRLWLFQALAAATESVVIGSAAHLEEVTEGLSARQLHSLESALGGGAQWRGRLALHEEIRLKRTNFSPRLLRLLEPVVTQETADLIRTRRAITGPRTKRSGRRVSPKLDSKATTILEAPENATPEAVVLAAQRESERLAKRAGPLADLSVTEDWSRRELTEALLTRGGRGNSRAG